MKNSNSYMKNTINEVRTKIQELGYKIDKQEHYGIGCYVNGIKVEWNKNSDAIKLGIQNSPKDLESIIEYLKENVTNEIERTKKGKVILIFKNPTIEQYFYVINKISGHNIDLEKRVGDGKKRVNFDQNYIFQKIVKIIKLGYEEKLPQILSRAGGLFDSIDNLIVIGESIHRTHKNTYREHIVPCNLIIDYAIEMIENGFRDTEIALFIKNHCSIVLITHEEAKILNSKYRDDMPKGWKIGDCPFAKLKEFGIILK